MLRCIDMNGKKMGITFLIIILISYFVNVILSICITHVIITLNLIEIVKILRIISWLILTFL